MLVKIVLAKILNKHLICIYNLVTLKTKAMERPCYNVNLHTVLIYQHVQFKIMLYLLLKALPPLLDIMKISKKEYAVTHPRTFGNPLKIQILLK